MNDFWSSSIIPLSQNHWPLPMRPASYLWMTVREKGKGVAIKPLTEYKTLIHSNHLKFFFVLIWPFNCEIVHYCANVVLKLMIPRLEISFHNIFIVNTMMDWKVSDHRQTYFISMQMKYVWPWQLKNVQKGLKNR